jgi:hypothetical protein
MSKSPKVDYFPLSSSMYHLAVPSIRVCWNKHNQIDSSLSELDEHRKWNVFMWSYGSSPLFHSNLGIYEGVLVRIVGKLGS